MGQFAVRPLAWREIDKALDYLEQEAGLEVAERFLDELIRCFEALGDLPEIRACCGFTKPSTRRLRRWPVKGFENWLIFYQPRRTGIEVVHVMHGSRDISRLFGGRL